MQFSREFHSNNKIALVCEVWVIESFWKVELLGLGIFKECGACRYDGLFWK